MSRLFSTLQIRNITLKNRIVMSPMCQYSARDGYPNDWHFVHYITRAIGGCAAIIQEATAVSPEGRISYGDLGLWDDHQIEAYNEITSFIEKYGAVPGIQLAHAGRKASTDLMWNGSKQIKEGPNSWPTYSASALPFNKTDIPPIEMDREEIEKCISDFREATRRAIEAGYRIIEVHAAHGYLIHQFLSPLSNKRTDQYGGSFENRIRLLVEITEAISPLTGENHSLWVRISATDWTDGGWTPEESVELARVLHTKSVDLIDVSTGGILPDIKIDTAPGYQVPFSAMIKKEAEIKTSAVGLITHPDQAEELLKGDTCDLILLGRQLLREPYFAGNAARHFKEKKFHFPEQYERGYK